MLDWTRIDTLRDEIGAEDFYEVVNMFLDEAREAVDRLDGMQRAEDARGMLHFLKGSALNLGFSELARRCADGERAVARGADFDRDAISYAYACSRSALLEGLAAKSVA